MRKLDQRGVAALEFSLVAVPLFLLTALIFDLGLYAIHVQSLRRLANSGARAMMIRCYTPTVIGVTPSSPWSAATSPSSCTGDPLPTLQAKKDVAPFVSSRRLHAYTEHNTVHAAAYAAGYYGYSHCAYCYGIFKLRHDGVAEHTAERVHVSSRYRLQHHDDHAQHAVVVVITITQRSFESPAK